MFFKDGEFSKEEQAVLKDSHLWMEKYYKILKGSYVENIGIAVDEVNQRIAFLTMDFRLADGRLIETELVSTSNINEPGLIMGLPIDSLIMDDNTPNSEQ